MGLHTGGMMSSMRCARRTEVWWVRCLVISTALLVLATGFCLFDLDHEDADGHATQPDLCMGMLAVSLAVLLLVRPLAAGWAINPVFTAPLAVVIYIPDPPPKPTSLP